MTIFIKCTHGMDNACGLKFSKYFMTNNSSSTKEPHLFRTYISEHFYSLQLHQPASSFRKHVGDNALLMYLQHYYHMLEWFVH